MIISNGEFFPKYGSRHSIDASHGNQYNKCKLALYKPLHFFKSCLKWLYISSKTEPFSYKCGYDLHGPTRIKVFKKELAWIKYTWLWVISIIMKLYQ